jgi:hypothetical protein
MHQDCETIIKNNYLPTQEQDDKLLPYGVDSKGNLKIYGGYD